MNALGLALFCAVVCLELTDASVKKKIGRQVGDWPDLEKLGSSYDLLTPPLAVQKKLEDLAPHDGDRRALIPDCPDCPDERVKETDEDTAEGTSSSDPPKEPPELEEDRQGSHAPQQAHDRGWKHDRCVTNHNHHHRPYYRPPKHQRPYELYPEEPIRDSKYSWRPVYHSKYAPRPLLPIPEWGSPGSQYTKPVLYPRPVYPRPVYPRPEYPRPEYPRPEYPRPEYSIPEYLRPEDSISDDAESIYSTYI